MSFGSRRVDRIGGLSRKAYWILILIVLAAWILENWAFALSVLVGGGVAILNFSFMKAGIDRSLAGSNDQSGGLILLGYLGRFVLILVCLFAMIHFSFLSLLGAVLGLSIFVLAGVLEALVLLIHGSG